MKHFCLGFLFTKHRDQVSLIRRVKKDWQYGLLNGIGGEVEVGETVGTAMEREFFEETGVRIPQNEWHQAIRYIMPVVVLHIFVATDIGNKYAAKLVDTGSGLPGGYEVKFLKEMGDLVPNLHWMIPMLTNFLETPQAPLDIRQNSAKL